MEELSPERSLPARAVTPVCAIGASAGGVGALQEFFERIGNDLGLAYVVIIHLAPDHPSALSEILASRNSMPVRQVEDKAKLEANHVFVIPSSRATTWRRSHSTRCGGSGRRSTCSSARWRRGGATGSRWC
jgi:two-component system, chemotaxis family, CheB/CheR fusion protein